MGACMWAAMLAWRNHAKVSARPSGEPRQGPGGTGAQVGTPTQLHACVPCLSCVCCPATPHLHASPSHPHIPVAHPLRSWQLRPQHITLGPHVYSPLYSPLSHPSPHYVPSALP